MNTNPQAIKVLCYGDSNTWGQKPDKTGRFPVNVRWTGQLQETLGDGYYIIEEGLSSRTTDLDYERKSGRNGRSYLEPCLDSHNPIDVVILMLGTNDLKLDFNRTAPDIADAITGLIAIIKERAKAIENSPAKIILMSPIHVNADAPKFAEFYTDYYDKSAAIKSRELASELQEVAEDTNSEFLDAATVAAAGEDGLHIDENSHRELALLLSHKLQS